MKRIELVREHLRDAMDILVRINEALDKRIAGNKECPLTEALVGVYTELQADAKVAVDLWAEALAKEEALATNEQICQPLP